MYKSSNRPLSCAIAAIFVAAMLTTATVDPAYAGTESARDCSQTTAKPSRMILA